MGPLFQTIDDLCGGRDAIRGRPYGVIEAHNGRFRHIRLRPFPKVASVPGIVWIGGWQHRTMPGDWCRLYYNQPRRFSNYLVLKYVVSGSQGTLASLHRVLETLDEIARIKGSDALLCDVANWRVSTAILSRWGWATHCPSPWHRHYIKRFYGDYPPRPVWLAKAVGAQVIENELVTSIES